jgi:D-alanine-D-alanine ligase
MSKNKTIGLFYNLKTRYPKSLDIEFSKEWDNESTVLQLAEGITNCGYKLSMLGDPEKLFEREIRNGIDIVFSICEMTGYRYRESIVPILCELLHIPYVFSKPDVMMITLDKNITSMLVRQAGIEPPWEKKCDTFEDVKVGKFNDFPYFVKLSCEGSGIGIDESSIVKNQKELFNKANMLLDRFKEPILIQEFLPGLDITVGILQKEESSPDILMPLMGKIGEPLYIIDDIDLKRIILETSETIFTLLGCRDAARLDFKIDKNGVPRFIDINPMPNLDKEKGYFMQSAYSKGYTYEKILEVLISNTQKRT